LLLSENEFKTAFVLSFIYAYYACLQSGLKKQHYPFKNSSSCSMLDAVNFYF